MNIKFLFLRFLLVDNTKKVLSWFDAGGKKSRAEYAKLWAESISKPAEVEEILKTLIKYGLVRGKNNRYSITQEGRDFLKYLGWRSQASDVRGQTSGGRKQE